MLRAHSAAHEPSVRTLRVWLVRHEPGSGHHPEAKHAQRFRAMSKMPSKLVPDYTLLKGRVMLVGFSMNLSSGSEQDASFMYHGDTRSVSALLDNKGAHGLIVRREATIATDNTGGADAIIRPAGTLTLTIDSDNKNNALRGDLDINDNPPICDAVNAGIAPVGGDDTEKQEEIEKKVKQPGQVARLGG